MSKLKVIGEKINGTRRPVAQAIEQRDAAVVRDLAIKQAEAGAAWLDVNAGTRSSAEPDDLVWLIETIQPVVEIPLCLDSANPAALAAGMRIVERTPMVNSISGEPQRMEGILPLVAEHGCSVIALSMDSAGIPATCEGRLRVARRLMAEMRAKGVPDDHVYLDPLAMTLATNTDGAKVTLDTIRAMRQEFPDAHLTMGLSNISFGLPARSHINRAFLTLALAEGLDSAILDPLDREMMAALIAAELVLGQDHHCLSYTRAFRAGLFARSEVATTRA
ncbi:MAG: dihydropteroate synthase [Chloroflexi bacterium]|nr:dihydropteroate synthase [Chloroflexota bacterium]